MRLRLGTSTAQTRRALCSVACVGCVAVGALTACDPSAAPPRVATSSPSHAVATTEASASPSATTSTTPAQQSPSLSAPTTRAPRRRPIVVIDPGHSPTIHAIDPRTGLDVSDYENEPEMTDVFAVALLVKKMLTSAGYRVVLTKTTVRARVSLAQRAEIANRAHADLALSIHDQAGPNGGIPFASGNNIVYYQSVGDYRSTPAGKKIRFTNAALAARSKRFAAIFRAERAHLEHTRIELRGDVGYDLGTRGLAPGDIWLVQLLSDVPWVYNEAGGNSAGRSGLDAADKRRYADALVASVERCLPITR